MSILLWVLMGGMTGLALRGLVAVCRSAFDYTISDNMMFMFIYPVVFVFLIQVVPRLIICLEGRAVKTFKLATDFNIY
ncbi:hypothetical protein CD58_22510 [Pseudomonas brassicacearum]|uniref:hypothetical protein n=1 Tax=Pseudomonas brassicacearum TaxID=930166 RepID=UPI00042F6147|nr:hypothetical protein [Pseudomonas brassicacearum]AHL36932.1 hypothetical protein CD58_22510 [Pseudomonas brassicacearum]